MIDPDRGERPELAVDLRPGAGEAFESWLERGCADLAVTRQELFVWAGLPRWWADLDLARGICRGAVVEEGATGRMIDALATATATEPSQLRRTLVAAGREHLLPRNRRRWSCPVCAQAARDAGARLRTQRSWLLKICWFCYDHAVPLVDLEAQDAARPPVGPVGGWPFMSEVEAVHEWILAGQPVGQLGPEACRYTERLLKVGGSGRADRVQRLAKLSRAWLQTEQLVAREGAAFPVVVAPEPSIAAAVAFDRVLRRLGRARARFVSALRRSPYLHVETDSEARIYRAPLAKAVKRLHTSADARYWNFRARFNEVSNRSEYAMERLHFQKALQRIRAVGRSQVLREAGRLALTSAEMMCAALPKRSRSRYELEMLADGLKAAETDVQLKMAITRLRDGLHRLGVQGW